MYIVDMYDAIDKTGITDKYLINSEAVLVRWRGCYFFNFSYNHYPVYFYSHQNQSVH